MERVRHDYELREGRPMEKGSKRYLIRWTDCVGYYTHIYAKTEEEAKEAFLHGEMDGIEPSGFCEVEYDSIEITEEETP